MLRRDVEHGAVGGQRIFDRLLEVPLLRRDRIRQIAARQVPSRHERNLHRRRAADRFGQQADHVVVVDRGAQAAVPPRRIARAAAHGRAGLAFDGEAVVHRRADQIDAERHQRIEHVVERIAERRREQHRAGRSGLMVVVHDLREPLHEQLPVHVLGFLQIRHVRIAVVVVARVFLVEPRHAGQRALQRILLAHVPVGDEIVAVGIGVRGENDDVAEEARGLGIVLADQLVDRLHQLLRAEHFRGVQAAVDPHDRLAFRGERARLIVGQPFGQRELPRDLLVARQLLVVFRRGDDRHQLRSPLFGLADVDDASSCRTRRRASSSIR